MVAYRMPSSLLKKIPSFFVICVLVLGLAGNLLVPIPLSNELPESNKIPIPAPLGMEATILYPHLGHAAILLNGSQLEVMIRGPSNISSWAFTLFREYQSYSLSYTLASFNSTTGIWSVNVTIPAAAMWDLYDLQVTVSDGLTQLELEEWNAIQVRYSFPENFTIMHVTDTHFFSVFGGPDAKLLAAQNQAAMMKADLIILTGDITDTGQLGAFINIRKVLRQSRVPYLIMPGNHDRDVTGFTFTTYKSFFHTDYYTANLGPDIFLIAANSFQETGNHYRLNTTQLSWIERDLAASDAKTKILAFHAPIYYVDTPYYFLPESEVLELFRIADEYNLTIQISGHLHNDRVDIINGTYFVQTAPTGGSTWSGFTEPGHHRNAFRVIQFENYTIKSLSWKYWNWSQPWDVVQVQRDPADFRSQDKGSYFSIINNLSVPLYNQQIDFLLEPLSGPTIYHVSGATVVKTINASTSWFMRLNVDILVNGVAIIRVFPSTTQAPLITSITFPSPGLVGSVIQIVAEVINPLSAIHMVQLNLSTDSKPYTLIRMSPISTTLYRFARFYGVRSTLDFRILASDYSGLSTISLPYHIVVTNQPSPPILANPGELSETGNITLGWTASIDDDGTIDHYVIQTSNASDFGIILREDNATSTTTTLFGLTDGVYHFRVHAVDNDNAVSIYSNIQNITVEIAQITLPPPPDNWLLLITIAGVVGVVIIILVVIVYFIRFRKAKSE